MNKSLITGLVVGGVAVTAAGAFAGYQAMDARRSAEVLNVEALTQTVEQRCRTVYDSVERPDGYEVRHRLNDQEGTVRMDHAPGRTIPVENGQLVLTELNYRG